MRSIIQLKAPLALSDGQGNKFALEQFSGDISISGNTVHFQPSLHQVRDAINQVANSKAQVKSSDGSISLMSHTEMFVLSDAEVLADEEMSILLEQIRQRATDLIKAKLDAI